MLIFHSKENIKLRVKDSKKTKKECMRRPLWTNNMYKVLLKETFIDEQYVQGLIEGMIFTSLESTLHYKEHARLKGFGIVEKTSNKKSVAFIRYVIYACDNSRKSKRRNQSKRVDYQKKINYSLMDNDLWVVYKAIIVHNHEIDSSFL